MRARCSESLRPRKFATYYRASITQTSGTNNPRGGSVYDT